MTRSALVTLAAILFGAPSVPAADPPRVVRESIEWLDVWVPGNGVKDQPRVLAPQMYESRDFGAMPILADALQDAGCDNEGVFNHCRGPGPHVRGCWVVDLVLNKE